MKGNNIFAKIFKEQCDVFINSFDNSKKIFHDPTKKNNLFHPGEFGIYREKIVEKFIKLLVPNRLEVNNGFVISPDNRPSQQADIVIYDRIETPVIKTEEGQLFYPIETVVSVGEVKSDLSKDQLILALKKLEEIKIMRESLTNVWILYTRTPQVVVENGFGAHIVTNTPFSPSTNWADQISTFIICNKLDFKLDLENIESSINPLYSETTKPRHKVDFILSINDGFIAYYDKKAKKFMEFTNFETNNLYPNLELDILLPTINKYIPFGEFAACLNNRLSFTTIVKPEIQVYLKDIEKEK